MFVCLTTYYYFQELPPLPDNKLYCPPITIRVTNNARVFYEYFQELPDNELYCPPITIRCIDCRNFGRFVLVGTHVIDNMRKFMYVPTTKTVKEVIKKFIGTGRLNPSFCRRYYLSVPLLSSVYIRIVFPLP